MTAAKFTAPRLTSVSHRNEGNLRFQDALFDVLVLTQQIQGIVGSIATNENLDIDPYFKNALWGALSLLNQSEEIIKATNDQKEIGVNHG